MGTSMGKSIANFAQNHRPEERRQVEDAHTLPADPAALLPLHFSTTALRPIWKQYNIGLRSVPPAHRA